jgi:tRNA(adenine34) deaminase
MCAGAIAWARVRRLYFGAYDPKSGGVEHGARVFDHPTCHHKPEVIGGMQENLCGTLLQDFFQQRRSLTKEMHLGQFNWDEWKSYRDTGKR